MSKTLAPLAQIVADVEALKMALSMDDAAGVDRDDLSADLDAYLTDLLPSKIDSYSHVLRDLDADISKLKAWEDDLRARRKAQESRKARLFDRLAAAMQAMDTKAIEGEVSKFVLVDSTPKVQVTDASVLPAEFIITKTTESVDKNAIKALIQRGEHVPGAALERGQHVRKIR